MYPPQGWVDKPRTMHGRTGPQHRLAVAHVDLRFGKAENKWFGPVTKLSSTRFILMYRQLIGRILANPLRNLAILIDGPH
jgi:hypothetical protein